VENEKKNAAHSVYCGPSGSVRVHIKESIRKGKNRVAAHSGKGKVVTARTQRRNSIVQLPLGKLRPSSRPMGRPTNYFLRYSGGTRIRVSRFGPNSRVREGAEIRKFVQAIW